MPEDEVPAAPFSSGRLSATENGLEKVVGSLSTMITRWGRRREPANCGKGMGRKSVRRVRTLVPRARYARIGGGHYQQSYLLMGITSNPALAFGDGGDRRLDGVIHAAVRHENCCRPAGEAVTKRDRLHNQSVN